MDITNYPKIYNLGHSAIRELFNDAVYVQEKVDGSQFSFKLNKDGQLYCKSHHCLIHLEDTTSMFKEAVETVKSIQDKLIQGWTYRGEYLQKPKHNCLAYDRIPKGNIILFDVDTTTEGAYVGYDELMDIGRELGLEVVPLLFYGMVGGYDQLAGLLELTSILGGQTVEGVVIKNYNRWGRDGKVLMGKYVNDSFREKQHKDWKLRNPGKKDVIAILVDELRTTARWEKAVIHLREKGEIEDSPRDIGKLIAEVCKDVEDEETEYIKEKLWKWARKVIKPGLTRGLPEWYKEQLAKKQFGE